MNLDITNLLNWLNEHRVTYCGVYPSPAHDFCPENFDCSFCQLHRFKCTQTTFIPEANTINPDQTAPNEQSDLGSYVLHFSNKGYQSASADKIDVTCCEWRDMTKKKFKFLI